MHSFTRVERWGNYIDLRTKLLNSVLSWLETLSFNYILSLYNRLYFFNLDNEFASNFTFNLFTLLTKASNWRENLEVYVGICLFQLSRRILIWYWSYIFRLTFQVEINMFKGLEHNSGQKIEIHMLSKFHWWPL